MLFLDRLPRAGRLAPASHPGVLIALVSVLLLAALVGADAAAAAPTNTAPPVLSGTSLVGGGLTTSTGTWTGQGAITYAYQWQRCDSYRGLVLQNNPGGYWRLGDTAGQAARDETPNQNSGAYLGGVAYGQPSPLTDGNTAVWFDGASGTVNIPYSPSINAPATGLTMEAWVKPTNDASLFDVNAHPRTVMAKNGPTNEITTQHYAFELAWDPSGSQNIITVRLGLGPWGTAYSFRGAGWQLGVWNHIAITYDGSFVRAYVNGSNGAAPPVPASGVLDGGVHPLEIGGQQGTATFYHFPGTIDEAAVYPIALTQQQVQGHYAAALGNGSCANIPGATDFGYSPTPDDIAKHLRVLVTATDAAGSSTAASTRTNAVPADQQVGDSGTSTDPNAVPQPPNDDTDPSLPNDDYFRAFECPPEGCPPSEPQGLRARAAATTVDRAAIADYVAQYHGQLNTDSPQGYHPAFRSFSPNDCQNFVSQALHYGGWPMDQGWFYNTGSDRSASWAAVFPFKRYVQASSRGKMVWYLQQVKVGDVLLADWNGDTDGKRRPSHSMIVHALDGTPGQPGFDVRLSYHTRNRYNKSFRQLKAENTDAIFWMFHIYNSF